MLNVFRLLHVDFCDLSFSQLIIPDNSSQISHRLGPIRGWRSKRLRIAIALRKQGWTYKAIGEHLYISPKSIMRDIKCNTIKSREKKMLQEVNGLLDQLAL